MPPRILSSPILPAAILLAGVAGAFVEASAWHVGLLAGLAVAAWVATAVRALQYRAQRRYSHEVLAANLHRAFAHHPSPVFFLDRARRFVNLNERAVASFGLDREELIGRRSAELLAPEHRELADRYWRDVMRGIPANYQAVVALPGGERYDANVVLVPMVTDAGVTGALGIVENIRDRVRHQRELEHSRQMLQTIVDHLPLMVFWKDAEQRLQGCNRHFADFLGLARDRMLGRTDTDLLRAGAALAPDMVARYAAEDRAVLTSGKPRVGEELQVRRSDGSTFWARTSKIPLFDPDGSIGGLLGVSEDITERKLHELRLRRMATRDGLTGLANRPCFLEQLERTIGGAATGLAVIYFDIDRFKSINDTWGHEAGDRVIRLFARRVRRTLRAGDTVGRLGGDEFVLFTEVAEHQALVRLCRRLVAAVERPMRLGSGRVVRVSTSLGVAVHRPGETGGQLLDRADQAMYQAKQQGRGRFRFA